MQTPQKPVDYFDNVIGPENLNFLTRSTDNIAHLTTQHHWRNSTSFSGFVMHSIISFRNLQQ